MSLTLLLGACSSASDAPVTVRTRADNDLAVLDFANQRFSGQRGFCLWTEYYRMSKTAEACGVALTPEEEHNLHAVMGAIERAILANARGEEVAGLRLRQGKVQLDQFYQTLSSEDHLTTCGDRPDLLSQVIQNYLSKRVSDSVLRQTQVKGDPFELFCSG